MASHLPFRIVTHKQKVLSLYKRACRNLESWYGYNSLIRVPKILKTAPTCAEWLKSSIQPQDMLFQVLPACIVKFNPSAPVGIVFTRSQDFRLEARYQVLVMRARFEKNRNVTDEKKLTALLVDGEDELFKTMHWQPKKFANTIGGNNYGRAHNTPDWVLDYWHPLEKAKYPEYFLRREQRKQEFVKNWIKEHGPLDAGHHH